jgi:hypothetical protein
MADCKPGEAPDDAVNDRDAQQHDRAGGQPEAGNYPSDSIENREGENTPDAADPHVEWDERVQPERADETERK